MWITIFCNHSLVLLFAAVTAVNTASNIRSSRILQSGPPTIGLYYWTYDQSPPTFPSGTIFTVAFSGYADPTQALQNSAPIFNSLQGYKWISLGGDNGQNDAGSFTSAVLTSVNDAINSNAFAGYNGIVFDVEKGDAGLASAFATCFKSCHANGLDVFVTTSHSAPFGISDGADLMRSFFTNNDIHFLSPQLYTSGTEITNDFTPSQGVQFSEYTGTNAIIIPSIVSADLYADAQSQFASLGVTTQGFIQWSQTAQIPCC